MKGDAGELRRKAHSATLRQLRPDRQRVAPGLLPFQSCSRSRTCSPRHLRRALRIIWSGELLISMAILLHFFFFFFFFFFFLVFFFVIFFFLFVDFFFFFFFFRFCLWGEDFFFFLFFSLFVGLCALDFGKAASHLPGRLGRFQIWGVDPRGRGQGARHIERQAVRVYGELT